jgi:hypothetical protein
MYMYLNGPTVPLAVSVKSAKTSLYVPPVCEEELVVKFLEEQLE